MSETPIVSNAEKQEKILNALQAVLEGNMSVEAATVNMDAAAKASFMKDLESAGYIGGTEKNLAQTKPMPIVDPDD